MKEIERAFIDRNFVTWLGMRLVAHTPGSAIVELPVRPEFIQTADTVHGGIVATIADCALACAILSDVRAGVTCSTIEMKVNYLASVREGTLRAESSVIRSGRRIGVSRADIYCNETLIAVAVGTFMLQEVGKGKCPATPSKSFLQ